MIVDEARVAQYHCDGYLLVESVFSEREVRAVRHEVEGDQRGAARTYGRFKARSANLLHASGPYDSDHHRRAFIMCYNALADPQWAEPKTFEQRPCPVSAKDAIERLADSILSSAQNRVCMAG
jgi:hypothetical protein